MATVVDFPPPPPKKGGGRSDKRPSFATKGANWVGWSFW